MTEHKMENNSSNSFSVAFKYELDFILGVTMLAVVLVEEIIYIPCLLAMWRRFAFSCYKILAYMGAMDAFNLLLFCGVIGCVKVWEPLGMGPIFNDHSGIFFLLSAIVFGLWLSASSACVLLAINRCLFFVAPELAIIWFRENSVQSRRTWIWLLVPSAWGLCNAFRGAPFLFYPAAVKAENNSANLQHLNESTPIQNDRFSASITYNTFVGHQIFIAVSLPLIYGIFGLERFLKYLKTEPYEQYIEKQNKNNLHLKPSKLERQLFLQTAIMSSVNFLVAILSLIFVCAGLDLSNPRIASLLIWIYTQSHGLFPALTLVMNPTLRKEWLKSVWLRTNEDDGGTHKEQAQQTGGGLAQLEPIPSAPVEEEERPERTIMPKRRPPPQRQRYRLPQSSDKF